jgi:hypothetical protein
MRCGKVFGIISLFSSVDSRERVRRIWSQVHLLRCHLREGCNHRSSGKHASHIPSFGRNEKCDRHLSKGGPGYRFWSYYVSPSLDLCFFIASPIPSPSHFQYLYLSHNLVPFHSPMLCTHSCSSSEGSDRQSLSLDNDVDVLIAATARAQPNTVAVVVTPGAVLMPWSDQVCSSHWAPGSHLCLLFLHRCERPCYHSCLDKSTVTDLRM